MTYDPPPFPTGLAPGKSYPSAKPLQAALKAAGYLDPSVPLSDTYGPSTQAAVSRFYVSKGDAPTVAIGPIGWRDLFVQAYATPSEPAQDMRHTTWSGKTINMRTFTLLVCVGRPLTLVQGSYNRGVSASAGTHDGGGVVDVSVSGKTTDQRNDLVYQLRKAGFAAWLRTPAEGFSYHIHACAIGDQEMAPVAQEQVQQYFNGQNGLAGHGRDTFSGGRPWPQWANKYNH